MTTTVTDVFTALLVIGLLIVVAKWLRRRVRLFRRLFLPASLIGGTLALLAGEQVLGRLVAAVGGPDALEDGLVPAAVAEVWAELPVLLISVVFAGLFIGKTIPGLREIWEVAGPQVALGQSIAWVSTSSGCFSASWSCRRCSGSTRSPVPSSRSGSRAATGPPPACRTRSRRSTSPRARTLPSRRSG